MPSIISFVGNSGVGKTTLLEKLIVELKKRHYKIGVIKHAFAGFQFDKKDKDSWRHRKAGADTVMVVSEKELAIVKNYNDNKVDINNLIDYFSDMDLIIIEGYKLSDKPKIELFRKNIHKEPLFILDNNLVAFITDFKYNLNIPQFGLEEISQLTDFIENTYLCKTI